MAVVSSKFGNFPGLVEGLPNICGQEAAIAAATEQQLPVFTQVTQPTGSRLGNVSAGFAITLHMHQPTIPGGRTGELINNLQYMFEHPFDGDNHNAGPFAYCYGRIGDFIPELVSQGCDPRVMLDYTGTLLWGLQQMRREDILSKLRKITCDVNYQPYVEWLGTFWGHGLADSIPATDIKLQVRAWQHHFAALFGLDALSRIRGFSLPKMQLPSDPDMLYALITVLKECGYQWLMVPEHAIETLEGKKLVTPQIPHRLIAKASNGAHVEIAVLVKTSGLDTQLVGQMHLYKEAQALSPVTLQGLSIPPLVVQIADGENGGVMMNEFPSAFKRTWHEVNAHPQRTVGFNGTEYLEMLATEGFGLTNFPSCQATQNTQQAEVIDHASTQRQDGFNMSGGWRTKEQCSGDNDDSVRASTEALSRQFHSTVNDFLNKTINTDASQQHSAPGTRGRAVAEQALMNQHRYRNALLHNLLLQTSCFRYWGQGDWTDYAQEIYRRGLAILENDFKT